jgi:hypothetical protein
MIGAHLSANQVFFQQPPGEHGTGHLLSNMAYNQDYRQGDVFLEPIEGKQQKSKGPSVSVRELAVIGKWRGTLSVTSRRISSRIALGLSRRTSRRASPTPRSFHSRRVSSNRNNFARCRRAPRGESTVRSYLQMKDFLK